MHEKDNGHVNYEKHNLDKYRCKGNVISTKVRYTRKICHVKRQIYVKDIRSKDRRQRYACGKANQV